MDGSRRRRGAWTGEERRRRRYGAIHRGGEDGRVLLALPVGDSEAEHAHTHVLYSLPRIGEHAGAASHVWEEERKHLPPLFSSSAIHCPSPPSSSSSHRLFIPRIRACKNSGCSVWTKMRTASFLSGHSANSSSSAFVVPFFAFVLSHAGPKRPSDSSEFPFRAYGRLEAFGPPEYVHATIQQAVIAESAST